jgi:hypothetical protein
VNGFGCSMALLLRVFIAVFFLLQHSPIRVACNPFAKVGRG